MVRSNPPRRPVTTFVSLLLFSSGLVATERMGGLQVGYGQDFGFMVNSTISDFAQGFPWDARFGFGYTSLDPGDALAARRIFINDGNNGTPQEGGTAWDLRLDLLRSFEFFEKSETFYFLGVRYSNFTADFKYVGGNEEFEVKSTQWGLGAGIESHHPLLNTDKVDLVITAMVDYYQESALSGHDTSYDPDGSDVNPRRNYTYGDADAAISQPKLVPRVMIGINRKFGRSDAP